MILYITVDRSIGRMTQEASAVVEKAGEAAVHSPACADTTMSPFDLTADMYVSIFHMQTTKIAETTGLRLMCVGVLWLPVSTSDAPVCLNVSAGTRHVQQLKKWLPPIRKSIRTSVDLAFKQWCGKIIKSNRQKCCFTVAHIPEEAVITDNWQDLGTSKLGH